MSKSSGPVEADLNLLVSLTDIRRLEFLKRKFPFKAILKPPLKPASWQGSWSELGLKLFSSN